MFLQVSSSEQSVSYECGESIKVLSSVIQIYMLLYWREVNTALTHL